jgi:hypothetical protein
MSTEITKNLANLPYACDLTTLAVRAEPNNTTGAKLPLGKPIHCSIQLVAAHRDQTYPAKV